MEAFQFVWKQPKLSGNILGCLETSHAYQICLPMPGWLFQIFSICTNDDHDYDHHDGEDNDNDDDDDGLDDPKVLEWIWVS